MSTLRLGIIMNGVTGRMGRNQHLARSIAAIRADGGIVAGSVVIWPDPVLVGRDIGRLQRLADEFGIERVSTDLDSCLGDDSYQVYFDAQTTLRREPGVMAAIAAHKDVYCEKPVATSSAAALELSRLAVEAGAHNGVVQDKLFLPGLRKLGDVLGSGQLGRVLSVGVEFGYWVFDDAAGAGQRPSWNYRADEGGGIVLDMFCHFRYLFDHLLGAARSLVCTKARLLPSRVDERGQRYDATADDAAYALVELVDGAIATLHASWCVRPYRDDLLVIKVDGTGGSAVADLRRCRVQPSAATPCFTWNPDVPQDIDPRQGWVEVPDRGHYTNAFRYQWELFLRHVAFDEPFQWDLRDGARGVQFAELALQSFSERRWVEVPDLP